MNYPTKTQMLFALQRWERLRSATESLSADFEALLGGVKSGKEQNHPAHEHVWMLFEAYTETLASSFGDTIQTPDGWAGESLLEQIVADGGVLNPVEYVGQVIAARAPKPFQYARGSEGNEMAL